VQQEERRRVPRAGLSIKDGQPFYRSGAIVGRMVHAITSSMRASSIRVNLIGASR
jgi:hypothetical protein